MISVVFNGNRLDRYKKGLPTFKEAMKLSIKKAAFHTQSVIQKEFLSVSDGVASRPGGPPATRRTMTPGLRTGTGNLKRSIQTDFRDGPRGFEAAVGIATSGGAYDYGALHERRGIFSFLKPGLARSKKEIQKILSLGVRAFMQGL